MTSVGRLSEPTARLPVGDADHGPVAALVRKEVEHVGRDHLDRVLVDDPKERLQIERYRPQRVRPSPASHELEISCRRADRPSAKRTSPTGEEDRMRHGNNVITGRSHVRIKDTGMHDGSPVY